MVLQNGKLKKHRVNFIAVTFLHYKIEVMKIIFSFAVFVLLFAACKPKTKPAGKKIEQKTMLTLGGEQQYVEITGDNDAAPVLLFIHGGPGWPQTPTLRYFNSDLTKKFVLVSWDQRGCGKSYMENPAPANMSLQQIINDAHELTTYLKDKFKQRRIYLAGYSWGSIVGMELAQKYPDDYTAYIGICQVVNMRKGIEVGRQWIAEQAKKANDTASLNAIAKLNNNDTSFCKGDLACFMQQYLLVNKYKGATFNDSAAALEEKAMALYDDYKNYDWNKGFEFSAGKLEKNMFATDFTNVQQLKIPVYFLQGRHDWNVPSAIVAMYFENLSAPEKKIYWFENSGHNLPAEEPALFNETLMYKILKD